MPIIVYAESWEGKFRKSTYEAVSYAKNMSEILQQEVKSISVGDVSEEELKKLGIYGFHQLNHIQIFQKVMENPLLK